VKSPPTGIWRRRRRPLLRAHEGPEILRRSGRAEDDRPWSCPRPAVSCRKTRRLLHSVLRGLGLRLIIIVSGIRGRTPRAPWPWSCRLWAARFLLLSNDEAPPLLQMADAALNCAPVAVLLLVARWRAPMLVARWRAPRAFSDAFAGWNGRLDAPIGDPSPDLGGIVAAIPWAASGRFRGGPGGLQAGGSSSRTRRAEPTGS
jgi:hypothetical protein